MNKVLVLDLHGVINSNPSFFSILTQSLLKDDWQIHIATGSHIEECGIKEELIKYNIAYTHLYSIADYHRENKTDGMWYDINGDPWVSDEDWDKSKAEYCKKINATMCIDDTIRYARHFETPFAYMCLQSHKNNPNRYMEFIIEKFKERAKSAKKFNFDKWFNKNFAWFVSPSTKLGKEERNSQFK